MTRTKVKFNRTPHTEARLKELGYIERGPKVESTWSKTFDIFPSGSDFDSEEVVLEVTIVLNDATTRREDVILWVNEEQRPFTGEDGLVMYLDELFVLFLEGIIVYEK